LAVDSLPRGRVDKIAGRGAEETSVAFDDLGSASKGLRAVLPVSFWGDRFATTFSIRERAMVFPTVGDCAGLRGATRELLHEFDHLLRDALVATQYRARQLDLVDEEVETACVTVMMSVVAGAVLAAAQSPADVTDAKFAAIARDALAWAKQRVGDASERRH
jgi:hypothetical protein